MEWITLNHQNIDQEHICCALSSNRDQQVCSKKEWLKQEFDKGLVFVKGNIRGKCFIEYLPIEHAWISIKGKDFMHINCFWVAGKYQGNHYAKELLNNCIEDSKKKGKKGITILSCKKKAPYIMDYHFLVHFGFIEVDKWNQYVLLFLPFSKHLEAPMFDIKDTKEDGLVLYYSHQCPFNIKYIKMLKEYLVKNKIKMHIVHLQNQEEALLAPTPLTTYSLFYNKKFITREVLTVKKFETLWRELHEETRL